MKSSIKTDSKGRKKVLNMCDEPCAIEKGMRLIGGKWKGSIIYHLKDEPVRFNDLTRMLGGATKKMVDQRLKELEQEGMVIRKVISDRPVAVTYELTEFGRSALDILESLRVWSESNNIKI
ncbi:winged helix-turn-helix transcriptional regulator [Pseudoalteromonas umbrosa]|uniref:winged helix-turn-helix transcriptional regulator n=1 Tax=Pseudoalteromonas umbrosa TaxID=3048489 RepID=UPI0024C3B5D7|nr:helix-turn-helix domain-containing protein [Pseudoalteromonas sp. B95]MDK1285988.1 helix-turn-helix domain-containing protein [Pseudoalteromonas sp. B95]